MEHFPRVSCLILTTTLKYHHYFHFNLKLEDAKHCILLKATQLTTNRARVSQGFTPGLCKALEVASPYSAFSLPLSPLWGQKCV